MDPLTALPNYRALPTPHLVLDLPHEAFCLTPTSPADAAELSRMVETPSIWKYFGMAASGFPVVDAEAKLRLWEEEKGQWGFPGEQADSTKSTRTLCLLTVSSHTADSRCSIAIDGKCRARSVDRPVPRVQIVLGGVGEGQGDPRQGAGTAERTGALSHRLGHAGSRGPGQWSDDGENDDAERTLCL